MNVIWLQVMSGLCSRLRAVVGAIAYCEETGKRLVVDWPIKEPSETSGEFPARMSDLWDHPYEERDSRSVWPTSRNGSLTESWSLRYKTCHIEDFLPWFKRPIGEYLERMNPTERVRKEIGTVHISEKVPMVGVNIRYALKQPDVVDPEWFVNRMKEMPAECHFFLSADSKEVRDMIVGSFPGRVQTTPKSYRYDLDGIVRACADLYILQKCDWVIGSNHSSYSQMAAFMRGAEYVGPHSKRNGIRGGRYEDSWNPPEPGEVEKCLGS